MAMFWDTDLIFGIYRSRETVEEQKTCRTGVMSHIVLPEYPAICTRKSLPIPGFEGSPLKSESSVTLKANPFLIMEHTDSQQVISENHPGFQGSHSARLHGLSSMASGTLELLGGFWDISKNKRFLQEYKIFGQCLVLFHGFSMITMGWISRYSMLARTDLGLALMKTQRFASTA